MFDNLFRKMLDNLFRKKRPPTLEDMLKDMAQTEWEQGKDMPFIGIYMSDFGEHEIIILTKEQVELLKSQEGTRSRGLFKKEHLNEKG